MFVLDSGYRPLWFSIYTNSIKSSRGQKFKLLRQKMVTILSSEPAVYSSGFIQMLHQEVWLFNSLGHSDYSSNRNSNAQSFKMSKIHIYKTNDGYCYVVLYFLSSLISVLTFFVIIQILCPYFWSHRTLDISCTVKLGNLVLAW